MEPDGEAKPEGGEAKAEDGEQPPAQQEGEAEPASQTVTVEATIEGEQGLCVHVGVCACGGVGMWGCWGWVICIYTNVPTTL